MSLELALSQNTAALIAMTAALLGRAAPAPAAGDPAGTRYFLNQTHNTTYKLLPTDPDVVLANSVPMTAEDFAKFKAAATPPKKETAPAKEVKAAAKKVAASAEAAAPTPPTAEVEGASETDDVDLFGEGAAEVVVDYDTMVAKMKEAMKVPGNSQASLMPILKAVGVSSIKDIPKDKYAFVFAEASKLIK